MPDLLGDGGVCFGGLACRQVDCAAHGKPTTTLSGIVYDPAGVSPLYNVFVYVPSTTPEPIAPGSPHCSACQADVTGQPLTATTSDAHGWFHLPNVPTGDQVPLVLQIGKWRRQIVVPHIDACVDNTLLDAQLVRLPGKSSEGDMPRMALATGCDALECFLQGVGIDPSEFTGPAGPGHVHVYNGHFGGLSVDGAGDAYNLWASTERLAAYDMVLAACECAGFPRNTEGPAYDAMHQYLDGGGRFFTTHYHANWFAPPAGPLAFQRTAAWGGGEYGEVAPVETYFVDTSFPKGRAFADWLDGNEISPSYGLLTLAEARISVGDVTPVARRWIYGSSNASSPTYQAKYLSFETPVGVPAAGQCGRAVFSDVHVSGSSEAPGSFPAECASRLESHAVNERALEFLFFDLSSCVQDENLPPSQPSTH